MRELPRRVSNPLLWTGLSQLSKYYVTQVGFEPTLVQGLGLLPLPLGYSAILKPRPGGSNSYRCYPITVFRTDKHASLADLVDAPVLDTAGSHAATSIGTACKPGGFACHRRPVPNDRIEQSSSGCRPDALPLS